MTELDPVDARILAKLQEGFPAHPAPFLVLSQELSIPAGEILDRVRRMSESGVIRRISPMINAAAFGLASTLVALEVPPDRLDEVAGTINAMPGVTHNYARSDASGRCRYNLWFTLMAPSEDELTEQLEQIRVKTGLSPVSLPAKRKFKVRVHFSARDDG
ncbi:MAG TPA: Lrp/AsnC family transcriptional regulator [Candidatus Brocadiia bacterium]|nr:Lrp/AsnC family transcriptional regulator [Candidatus Brocadiia bacterium]